MPALCRTNGTCRDCSVSAGPRLAPIFTGVLLLPLLGCTSFAPRSRRRANRGAYRYRPMMSALARLGSSWCGREPSYAGGAAIAAAGARLRLDRRLTSMMRRPCAAQKPGDGTNGDDHKESGPPASAARPIRISTAIPIRNARTGLSTAAMAIENMAQAGRLLTRIPTADTDLNHLSPRRSAIRPAPHPGTTAGSWCPQLGSGLRSSSRAVSRRPGTEAVRRAHVRHEADRA